MVSGIKLTTWCKNFLLNYVISCLLLLPSACRNHCWKCTSISSLKHSSWIGIFECLVLKKMLSTYLSILSNYVPAEEFPSPLSSTYIIQDLKPLNMQAQNAAENLWPEEFSCFIPHKSVSECFASYLLSASSQVLELKIPLNTF